MHPEKSSSGRKLLFPLILVLSSAVESVSKDKISVLDDSLKLDLRGFRTRLGRQFKEAVAEDEDGVAIGLIDALQRWADALEDQISLMRKEMTELRAADRKSADELSTARLENADLRRQLDAVKAEAMANRGNDERDRIEVDAMREDLRVFSRSFSDFLGHYDSVAREVRSNHSTLLKEIAWAKKSVRDLSSSLGQADHDVGSVRTAVSELKDSVATLTQRDFILEKRLEASENLTETVATAINSEVTKIRESVVPAKTFAEAVAGLTKEIDLVARHMSKNISTTAQTLMKRVDASNRQASLALTDLRATTDTLETDLKRQGQAFSQDFDSFQKSVDLAKQKYDELTITLDKRLEQHAEMRGNLTAAMLRAMNELSDRVDENDAKLLTLKPDFEALDESHRQLVNQVGAEVVQLRVADANASKRLLKMETIGNTTDLRLGKIEKMIDVLDVAGESLRTEVTKNQSKVSNQFGRMEAHFVDLRRSLFERSQELTTLDERLDEVEEDARRSSSEAETMLAQITRVYVEQGKLIAGLDNRTLSLRADLRTNISRVLVFAAENKATLLELRVAEQRLEDEINGVRDAQQRQGAAMASTNAAAAANATRLAAATAAMQSDADGMTERLQNLEESLSRHVQSTGELEIQMGRVRVGHKDAVSSLRRNLGELESTIGELTTNLTAVTVNVGQTQDRVGRLGDRVIATESQLEQHALNFSKEFSNTDERFQMLQVNSSTLKANIVGLGNYINNINGDVGKLASTFEKYIGDITRGMVGVAENVTAMEKALEKQRSGIQSMKIEQEEIRSQSKSLDAQVQSLSSIRDSHSKDISGLKNEVSTLRTGMSGITTSLFGLKSQAVASADVSGRVSQLSDDLTATKREMGRLERSVSTVLPEMESLATDMDTVRRSVTSIAAEVSAGPPRFSCAVTSDEVKTSGVVSYDVCNVNSGGMMDRDTGHATVAVAGDYFLAFSANLVSSNAQAVWCALYRQPVGVDEGWQVLGMINNYQRGGDGVDDRDSGAMAIVASLEEGDQVWIEWRGYGESFLYSNPYRLISFTGFMLKKKT